MELCGLCLCGAQRRWIGTLQVLLFTKETAAGLSTKLRWLLPDALKTLIECGKDLV